MKELYNPLAAARFVLETSQREEKFIGKPDCLPFEAGLKIGARIYADRLRAFGIVSYLGIVSLLAIADVAYLLNRFIFNH